MVGPIVGDTLGVSDGLPVDSLVSLAGPIPPKTVGIHDGIVSVGLYVSLGCAIPMVGIKMVPMLDYRDSDGLGNFLLGWER